MAINPGNMREQYKAYKYQKDTIQLPQETSMEYKSPISLKNSKSNTKRVLRFLKEDHPEENLNQSLNQSFSSKIIEDHHKSALYSNNNSLEKFVNTSIQAFSKKNSTHISQNMSEIALNSYKNNAGSIDHKGLKNKIEKSEIAHNSAIFMTKYLDSIKSKPV